MAKSTTLPLRQVSGGTSVMGHLSEIRRDFRAVGRRFNQECGDLGLLRVGLTRLIVANSPELVSELLVRQASSLRKSRLLRAVLYPLAGDGLFTSDGPLWRRQRKVMAPLFQPMHLSRYAQDMVGATDRVVDGWKESQALEVGRETTRLTMDVAGRTLFDVDILGEAYALGQALTVALQWAADGIESAPLLLQTELSGALDGAGRRLHWEGLRHLAARLEVPTLWPGKRSRQLREALQVIESLVQRMIADRRAPGQVPKQDLLSRLLTAQDDPEEAMSGRQLRDEIVTLFVAGHETTATALAWALWLLARHREARERLEQEADALGHPPTAEDLPRLPFALQVFKESLRLYPPVPYLERETLEPIELGGHRVPAGSYVLVLPWVLHHREELWPDPETFDPSRFEPEAERARDRHAFVPFGAGSRICLGNHFALMEGPLVLARMAQRARLEAVDEREVVPDSMAATFRPKGDITLRVCGRKGPIAVERPARGTRPTAKGSSTIPPG